jgi:2-oxoglutarate dehydrogenase E2 component (dihydrolipoamide succinyltransferase)
MGESITQATVGAILKPAGSFVRQDEEILELETDKLNQVLYAPSSGLLTLFIKTGDVVTIGQVIGQVVESEAVEREAVVEAVKAEQPQSEEMAAITETPIKVEPIKEEKRTEKVVPLSTLRKAIAKRLVQVQHTTASLTTFNEVDMSEVIKLREQYKDIFMEKQGVKLGFMSFFVKAACSALKAFPIVNGYIAGENVVYRESVDISIAVSTDKGLFVPVLKDIEHLSFAEIEKKIAAFAMRAKEGTITLDDLKGGGFTITNGGIFGSMLSTPILNPPQCAILGMHTIKKRAVVVDDTVVIRPMMYLALTYDHRLLDGKEAVSFLVHIKNCIEDPHRLELGI